MFYIKQLFDKIFINLIYKYYAFIKKVYSL